MIRGDDRPLGLHEGFSCAGPECPKVTNYLRSSPQAWVPIIGVRFECTVCIPDDDQLHQNAVEAGVRRLSFCDHCWQTHTPQHPLTMHRTPLAPTAEAARLQLPEPLFIVLAVLDDRVIDRVKEYMINWEGPYAHSWHAKRELSNDGMIEEYEHKKLLRSQKKRKKLSRSQKKRKKLSRTGLLIR
jgi:hypothetical protein